MDVQINSIKTLKAYMHAKEEPEDYSTLKYLDEKTKLKKDLKKQKKKAELVSKYNKEDEESSGLLLGGSGSSLKKDS